MSKTVLDLLHSLGVEDDMIMFDDLWQLPQIKPSSVVGCSRLTLLDCLTTWVYLDNTRTRMRVLFYMVICASFYLDFRIFKVRSLRSRGGEIPRVAHVVRNLNRDPKKCVTFWEERRHISP